MCRQGISSGILKRCIQVPRRSQVASLRLGQKVPPNQRLQLTGDARDPLSSRLSAVSRGRPATEPFFVRRQRKTMTKIITACVIVAALTIGFVAYGAPKTGDAADSYLPRSASLPLKGELESIYWTVPALMPPFHPKSDMLIGFARGAKGKTTSTTSGDKEASIRILGPNETAEARVYDNYVVFDLQGDRTVIPLERIVEVNFRLGSKQRPSDVAADDMSE